MSSGSDSPRTLRSAEGRKRASKACSRCRRYRTKCVPLRPNRIGEPPCESCTSLGVESECVFLPRGQSAADRAHRRRPARRESTGDYDSSILAAAPSVRPVAPPSPNTSSSPIQLISEHRPSPSESLPPQSEVVEAIRNYVASYFQLGFLHKAIFVERYMTFPERVSEFLLLAICSIAAPFTPSLVSRYKGKKRATDFFLSRADRLLGKEMVEPSLERAQAFLLLGVTEWGQGNGSKAWMLIGTAVRMAGFLGLHRESTYHLPPNPSPETFIESEVARGASGGYASSVQGEKSLFASLVQVKILWSLTARQACRGSGRFETVPWSADSQNLLTALQDFETNLPVKHRFTVTNLRGMMVEGLDLAFLSITLITRLSNIVIRRMYLPSMASAIDSEGASDRNYQPHEFWEQMAHEMIWNSEQLLSQVETFFSMRSVQLGFPPIMVFGVYMCGNVFSYLWRWPELCLSRANIAQSCYRRCVDILAQLADSWPLASRWHVALQSSDQRPTRQPGLSRLRTAVQSERNFDDEMEDIYGRPAASIIGSSPDDRAHGHTSFHGPPSAEATTVVQQQTHISPQSQQQSQSHLTVHAASSAPSLGQVSDFLSFPNPVSHASIPALSDSLHSSTLPEATGENAATATATATDFFMDTFGDDLSAFLQSAVPVGTGDDGLGQIFFGMPPGRDTL
ncbi:hypothetical protein IAU59_007533 [Kwoniella sp. CBS 9459]